MLTHCFRRAVEAGDVDAMAHLGHMYANGNGVAQSNVTAMRWFKEAAEQVRSCCWWAPLCTTAMQVMCALKLLFLRWCAQSGFGAECVVHAS
jgi:hypothetical protein